MKRGRKAKDKFADLPSEYKDAVVAMSVDEIKMRISDVARAEEENLRLKKEDQQLAEARMAYTEAGAAYKEGTKMNRLKIQYAMIVLGDKGGA